MRATSWRLLAVLTGVKGLNGCLRATLSAIGILIPRMVDTRKEAGPLPLGGSRQTVPICSTASEKCRCNVSSFHC